LSVSFLPSLLCYCTGKGIRKLVKDGYIVRKPNVVHSRFRVNRRAEAKAKGRHTGYGKRRGCATARFPTKVMWVRRQRVLRRFLKSYRSSKKIDSHMHNELYAKCKGNVFKSKKVLMEHIHLIKSEKVREAALLAEAAARRERLKAKKAKVAARNE